jgi:hypothetical protein
MTSSSSLSLFLMLSFSCCPGVYWNRE